MKSAPKFVLVGVDEAPESQVALRWAIAEADARGLAVRVVRAYLDQVAQWPAVGMEGFVPPSQADRYQAELDANVAIVRDRLGYDRGSGWLANHPPADAILAEAPEAELIVLGSKVSSSLGAAVLGSVATAVTAKAPCPVVVVRGDSATGPVLVGTDGSADSDAALSFGFEQVARSGGELRVLYCWHPDRYDEAVLRMTEDLLRDWLVESLEPYGDKYPEVRVRAEVAAGRPAVVLAERSIGCSLVVVGSRGRGGVTGLLLGSVSQSLLHHSDCPVAVVRPQEARR